MDPNKQLPSRKPAPAQETHRTLQIGALRNRTNNDDGEFISARVPTDANIGRASTIKDNIAAAIASSASPIKYELKPTIKRLASSELLKIEGLGNYMGACAAYKKAMEEGWEKERLLRLMEEWRMMDGDRRPT